MELTNVRISFILLYILHYYEYDPIHFLFLFSTISLFSQFFLKMQCPTQEVVFPQVRGLGEPGEGPSRGLLCDCAIFANLRFQLYVFPPRQSPVARRLARCWLALARLEATAALNLASSSNLLGSRRLLCPNCWCRDCLCRGGE